MKGEKKYKEMKEITQEDYLEFLKVREKVVIEDVEIKFQKNWDIKSFGPPEDYTPERTTVWRYIYG